MENRIKCIIVSGPDNCGKDTACQQLKALLQNKSHVYPAYISSKFSKDINDWPGEMMKLRKFADDFINSGIRDVVLLLNRSWLDEDVYGPIYRNYGERDNDWLYLDPREAYDSILYINLTAPTDVLVEREDGNSFSHGLASTIDTEKERFKYIKETLLARTACHVLEVDTSKISREEVGEYIYNVLLKYGI